MTFALSLAAAAGVGLPEAARAQQRAALRFDVRPWRDGAVLATGLAAAAVPALWAGDFPGAPCAPCSPAHLWAVDRSTVGPMRGLPDGLSYATLGAEAALGAFFLARVRRGDRAAFLEDATVIAQAVTFTAAATEWTKVLFHRPRPYLYVPTATTSPAPDDARSFPSSHASIAFAAAAAYASILHRRGLAGSYKLQIGLLFAAATATSVLRVVAHQHFPTDVAAGAALGFAIGWTIPAIHPLRH